jgi:hypothetical protein
MKIFNYIQFNEAKKVDVNQIDLFAGSGTEYDSSPGIASNLVTNLATQSQLQSKPENQSATQSATQSGTQSVSKKEIICKLISNQGPYLYKSDGLGFQSKIQDVLDKLSTKIDYNPKKQDILKILYDSGKYHNSYRAITLSNGYYKTDKLIVNQVLDSDGNYDPVNKLNTNWSDIAELIYDILELNGNADDLLKIRYSDIKSYLKNYFDKIDVEPILNTIDIRKYIQNNRVKSIIGEEAENFVRDCFIMKGMNCIFQGGDGDPIDMVYGIDLILHSPKKDKYFFVQVKSDPVAALNACNNWRYSTLDFYCSPIIDEGVRKTILYTKENKNGIMFTKTPIKTKDE